VSKELKPRSKSSCQIHARPAVTVGHENYVVVNAADIKRAPDRVAEFGARPIARYYDGPSIKPHRRPLTL
jgi:hypothetical protein